MFEKQVADVQYTLGQMSDKQHNFHLVIVLDCSGSMQPNWQALDKIVRKFLETRSRKGDDRVSIVLFDCKATLEIENESIKILDYKNFPMNPRYGGTNYYNAFDVALTAIDMTSNGYRPFLIFFTDGAASDPEDLYLAKAR